jgi:hypothetical protein
MLQVIGDEQGAAGEANRTERGRKESDANDQMYFGPCGKRFSSLRACGLAAIYPATGWRHHGYQRVCALLKPECG